MIQIERPVLALVVVVAAIGGILYLEDARPTANAGESPSEMSIDPGGGERIDDKRGKYRLAREISEPAGFVNTEGITIQQLVADDKVILVDFWTYTCINCQRTFPYLNAWYEKYGDAGLEIVGVHTPEFTFEQRRENVVDAVNRHGIAYPVVLDNQYATWDNYDNRYWPQKYLIDHDGFIRYEHIGEGSYTATERKIQQLLYERAQRKGIEPSPVLNSSPVDPEAEEADFGSITTPEIYFGAKRNVPYLANAETRKTGRQELTRPAAEEMEANQVYLGGNWSFTEEYAEARSAGATITLTYGAKDLNFVAEGNGSVDISVRIDGNPPGDAAGSDLDADGSLTVANERLYNLARHQGYGQHRITITVEQPGLRAYTFTFG